MRIAILDDDPAIGEMIEMALHLVGHHTVRYPTPATLFAVLPAESTARAPFPFDFLIIDLHLLEGLSGVHVTRQMRSRYPTLPILLILAVSSWELETARKAFPSIQVLGEPFRVAALLAAITSGDNER